MRGTPMRDDNAVNILIVDDVPSNLEVLEAVLACPEYRLIKAVSGKQALTALLKEEFALILLDIQMPEMTGFDTAVMIKQRARSREVPILFITAAFNDSVSI